MDYPDHPIYRFNIIEINETEKYIIAQNDASNPNDPNLFSRFDYNMLNGDERLWICTIEYDARTEEEARSNQTSDFSDAADFRGCGGNGWIPITLSERNTSSPEENLEEPVQQFVRDNQEALDQTSDSGELTQPDEVKNQKDPQIKTIVLRLRKIQRSRFNSL